MERSLLTVCNPFPPEKHTDTYCEHLYSLSSSLHVMEQLCGVRMHIFAAVRASRYAFVESRP